MGRTGRFEAVDSLRAIAALSIFAYHSLFVTGHLTSANYGAQLRIGVPLFYAISGFLLFLPFAAATAGGESTPALRRYAERRLSRIVPAYWVALPVVAVLLERTSEVFSPSGLVTYFGFLQVYRLETFVGGIGQAWTLCVEMSFYIFLPLFSVALASAAGRLCHGERGRFVLQSTAVAAVIAGSVVWKVLVLRHVGGDLVSALVPLEVLPASLDAFGVGMAIALVAARVAPRDGVGLSARAVPLLSLCAAAVAFWAIGEVNGIGFMRDEPALSRTWSELAKKELEALFAGAMVLAAVSAERRGGLLASAFTSRPLRWLGEISYGIYLWHLVVLIVFAGSPVMDAAVEWLGGDSGIVGGAAGVAIALAVTVALAAASWRLVEAPMIERSHRSRQ